MGQKSPYPYIYQASAKDFTTLRAFAGGGGRHRGSVGSAALVDRVPFLLVFFESDEC